jgi:hypothetical protein
MLSNAFFAYIDPGTGSLVLQMLIAGFVGAGVFFRKTVGRIFGRNKPDDSEPAAETGEPKNEPLLKTDA